MANAFRILTLLYATSFIVLPSFGKVAYDIPSLKAELGFEPPLTTAEFDLTARVIVPCSKKNKCFVVSDGTNVLTLVDEAIWPRLGFSTGDIVHARGRIRANGYPDCLQIDVIGHEAPAPAKEVRLADIKQSRGNGFQLVTLRGIIRSYFHDDIDAEWAFLSLHDDDKVIQLVFMPSKKEFLHEDTELAATHLETANRSLLSCREELRNCLRDLRSEALETRDVIHRR